MPRHCRQLLPALAFIGWLWVFGLLVLWPGGLRWRKLSGASTPAATPGWTWAEVRSGNFTRQCEKWFNEHIGLRNLWVRLDNQIYFSIFHEAPTHKEGTTVVVTPDDWLYERHYLHHALSDYQPLPETPPPEVIAARIRSVQDKLARRGIPLLLVVAPNKAEVYPEHLPAARFGGRTPAAHRTHFETLRPYLKKAGVRYFDGPAQFADWKRAGQPDLFASTGTHWSYHAVYDVWQALRAELNPGMRRPLPAFELRSRALAAPQANDRDMLLLLNLLVNPANPAKVPNPVLVPQTRLPQDRLPRILWVHDSFGWNLIEQLYAANAAQPSESLYYFSTAMRIPGGKPLPLKVETIHWPEFIGQYDAVLVVWTEIASEYDSWKFFATLDPQL